MYGFSVGPFEPVICTLNKSFAVIVVIHCLRDTLTVYAHISSIFFSSRPRYIRCSIYLHFFQLFIFFLAVSFSCVSTLVYIYSPAHAVTFYKGSRQPVLLTRAFEKKISTMKSLSCSKVHEL